MANFATKPVLLMKLAGSLLKTNFTSTIDGGEILLEYIAKNNPDSNVVVIGMEDIGHGHLSYCFFV